MGNERHGGAILFAEAFKIDLDLITPQPKYKVSLCVSLESPDCGAQL